MSEWVLPLLAGGAAGVLSGFGVGGGTLLLVYMTAFAGLDQRLAQGINLLYFLPSAAMALPAHWRNGSVVRPVLLPAILAGLVTAGAAAWAATVMDVELLRRCFGGFLMVIGGMELFGKDREQTADRLSWAARSLYLDRVQPMPPTTAPRISTSRVTPQNRYLAMG